MSQSKLNEALEYSNFSASVHYVDVTVKVKVHVPDFKLCLVAEMMARERLALISSFTL
ncbi:MAG: hypothetical protein OXH16_19565 [Gemmatimonadetes bacterium]|nr:hypothetical protein [Gemmatimonadota bacterium]